MNKSARLLQLGMAWIFAFVITSCVSNGKPPSIAGDWQGTLGTGNKKIRLIINIKEKAKDSWTGGVLSIDQNPDWGSPMPVTSITFDGAKLKLSVPDVAATYEGTLSTDHTSIEGTWTQRASTTLALHRQTKENAWLDLSPHKVQLVTVDKDVKVEVLDWGGSGRPIIFLAGLGNSAHIFDGFATKLTPKYHVYAVTRRGFGASSAPAEGYSADRLGDDVYAVIDSLKIKRPFLAGHSFGGEELSSVGTRHPDKVAGLIYMDAAYEYAYYDAVRGDFLIDVLDLRSKLDHLRPWMKPRDLRPLVHELLQTGLPQLQKHLQKMEKDLQTAPDDGADAPPPLMQALLSGTQKYTAIPVPLLAIYAPDPADPEDAANTEAQAKALERGIPSARVVRLKNATHYVFLSNEADVLRELDAFVSAQP